MARTRGTGTPTALKLLRGDRKINQDEPIPDDGVPECPSRNPEVREVWDYTVEQLLRMRTLTKADRDTLHAYCEQVVQYRIAAEQLHEDGAVIQSPRGPIRHPAVAVMRESASMIKMFGAAFGLTPAARTAIKVPDQRPATKDRTAARLLTG